MQWRKPLTNGSEGPSENYQVLQHLQESLAFNVVPALKLRFQSYPEIPNSNGRLGTRVLRVHFSVYLNKRSQILSFS